MHRYKGATQAKLRTGQTLTIRPALPSDARAVTAFLEGLSSEARWLRYHSPVPMVRWWMVSSITEVDHDQREAFLAFLDDHLVGVAEWGLEQDRHDRAHIAVVVDDHVRRRGIARKLMRRLASTAREHGIEDLVATVMTVNAPVFRLIERLAPVRTRHFDGDAIEVVIPLRGAGPSAATA